MFVASKIGASEEEINELLLVRIGASREEINDVLLVWLGTFRPLFKGKIYNIKINDFATVFKFIKKIK